MDDDPRPPLPEWILEVYETLFTHIAEQNECCSEDRDQNQIASIPYDQAVDILLATDDLALEPEDIDYALERLLDRGYFYTVDNELRVTDTERK